MSLTQSEMGQTIEVVLVAHLFVRGGKREETIAEKNMLDLSTEDYQAFDNNWRLSRTITMPYHPTPGTRIRLPLIFQDERKFERLLEVADRLKVPRLNGLFEVDDVAFWLEDGLDHATHEFEVLDKDYARNLAQQLQDGYGFKEMKV